jgi:oxalate decarboxylase
VFSSYLPISSEGGHVSFQNNVPDPVTSGKELPTFKFELEKSEGKVMGGSYAKKRPCCSCPSPKESPAFPCAWSRA